MVTRDFSGREIVNALQKMDYRLDRTRGSHAVLKYTNPDTGEIRTVTVPLHDQVATGTLQKIAKQCGADDFQAWCEWIDDLR